MEEEYIDFDLAGTPFRMTKHALEQFVAAGDHLKAHMVELGVLCVTFAGLDHDVNRLFPPLLGCSEEQAACIVVENVATRCAQITRLLHLESALSEQFVTWVSKLLTRVSDELANERNRYVHDLWGWSWSADRQSVRRTSKKPRIQKPQSHQRPAVVTSSTHQFTIDEMRRLHERISTVRAALDVARSNLTTWRQTGELPQLDPRWLPASKPKARSHHGVEFRQGRAEPLPPEHYEFD